MHFFSCLTNAHQHLPTGSRAEPGLTQSPTDHLGEVNQDSDEPYPVASEVTDNVCEN